MSVELQANGPFQIAQAPQNGQSRRVPPKPNVEQFLAWCGQQSAKPLSEQAKQELRALWPRIAAQPLDAKGNFQIAPIKAQLEAILKSPPSGLTTPLQSPTDAVSITFLKTLPADFKAKVSCIRSQILSDPALKAAIFQQQCMGKENELAALCGNLAQLAEKFPPDEAMFKISDLIDRLAAGQIEISDISALNRVASGIESNGTRPMTDEVLRQKAGQLIKADPAALAQLRYELRMGEMAVDSRAQVQQFARSSTIFPPVTHADGSRSAQAKVDIVTTKTNIRTVATGNWDKAAVDAQIKELQTWVDARHKGHADFANKPILLVMPYASAAPGQADYDRLLRWCAQNEVHVRHSDSPRDYEIPNLAGSSPLLLVDPERQRALNDQLLLGKTNEDLKRFGDHLGFQIADVRWQIERLKGAFPNADRPASQTERLQQLETLLSNATEAHRAVEDKLGYKLPISPKPASEQDISSYRRLIDLGESADTGWEGLESLRQDLSKVGESLIRNGQDLIDTPNQVKALAQGVYQEAVELITDPGAKWEATQANAKALAQFINQICKDETMRNELVNKGVDYLKQVLTDPDTYLDLCGDLATELSGSGIANKIETALDNLELFKKLGGTSEGLKKIEAKIGRKLDRLDTKDLPDKPLSIPSVPSSGPVIHDASIPDGSRAKAAEKVVSDSHPSSAPISGANDAPIILLTPSKPNPDPKYKDESQVGRNSGNVWNKVKAPEVPSPNQLAALKGTYHQTGAAAFDHQLEDFNLNGLSIEEIVARVPKEAKLFELLPHENGVKEGFEYSWVDSKSGETWNVRLHGPDESAPVGSNAAVGWTARIEKKVKLDGDDVYFHMDGKGHFSRKDEALQGGDQNKFNQLKEKLEAKLLDIAETEALLKATQEEYDHATTAARAAGIPEKEYTPEQTVAFNKIRSLNQNLSRKRDSAAKIREQYEPYLQAEQLGNNAHIPIKGNPNLKGEVKQ